MSGRRRALPGTHRGARPERRRVPTAVRAVGLIAVGGLATGFGHHLSPAGEATGDPTASGVLDGAPAPVTGDSRADGPEATEVPRGSTATEAPRRQPRAVRRPGAREVPDDGPGVFRVAPAGARAEPVTTGELAYTVEVEEGLPFDPVDTGTRVERVLEHPRSWQGVLGQPLRRTTEVGDFRVLVASPGTTDALCAPLQTMGQVSCRNGDLVVLNADRWAEGIPDYDGALGQYRTYLVNHEVGHRLGQAHVECPAPGAPAPVMQQQTYGLDGCTRNPWPAGPEAG